MYLAQILQLSPIGPAKLSIILTTSFALVVGVLTLRKIMNIGINFKRSNRSMVT